MFNQKLYILSVASIATNILVFSLDTVPYIAPKIRNKLQLINAGKLAKSPHARDIILQSGINMLQHKKTLSIWDEKNGFTREVVKNLKNIRSRESAQDKLNHYPRAFLYYGLTEYAISNHKTLELHKVKDHFDSFINSSSWKIKRIDQVPFGLAALNLYDIYGDIQYLQLANEMFDFIRNQMDENGLISYRKQQVITFPDTLGLTIPFLLKYKSYSDIDTHLIAKNQMDYFIDFGVNNKNYMPVHGINRNNNIPVGSTNWGRGIGWYFIALSHFYKETGLYEKEYYGLIETLSKLKNTQGLWGQFPGSKDRFDASSTTMFLYSMIINNVNEYNSDNLLKMLNKFISNNGTILETSGDTYSLNNYPSRFGRSELSQGILLLILSKLG